MKEEKDKRPARCKWKDAQGRFYAVIGLASVILAATIIIAATAIGNKSTTVDGPVAESPDYPTVADDIMTMPVLEVSLTNDHGFFYNQTLGYYGHHNGVDFKAAVGEEVYSVKDGVVESIFKGDKLSGTEIMIDHGKGVKTLYRFVDEVEGLKVGDKVKKGQKIATVAEPNGGEYKDGAHLHFEVFKDGKSVNPEGYLPLADK